MRVELEINCWTVAAMLDWTDDARSYSSGESFARERKKGRRREGYSK
jgi:hypothetical protein